MRPVFLDTNILLYAAGGRQREPEKHAVSLQIFRDNRLAVSMQVIGEFYHNVRRKFTKDLSLPQAQEWIETLEALETVDVDSTLIRSAMFITERYKIQFWDAALIAASERLDAAILYSEDMSHGQKYGTVTVINPFRSS